MKRVKSETLLEHRLTELVNEADAMGGTVKQAGTWRGGPNLTAGDAWQRVNQARTSSLVGASDRYLEALRRAVGLWAADLDGALAQRTREGKQNEKPARFWVVKIMEGRTEYVVASAEEPMLFGRPLIVVAGPFAEARWADEVLEERKEEGWA